MENILQQRKYGQGPFQVDRQSEKLLEPDVHFLVVQERGFD